MKYTLHRFATGRYVLLRGAAMLSEEVLRDPDSEGWLTRLWRRGGDVSYTRYDTFNEARDAAIAHAEARFWEATGP